MYFSRRNDSHDLTTGLLAQQRRAGTKQKACLLMNYALLMFLFTEQPAAAAEVGSLYFSPKEGIPRSLNDRKGEKLSSSVTSTEIIAGRVKSTTFWYGDIMFYWNRPTDGASSTSVDS